MSKLTSIETHQKSIETKLSKLDKLESEMCKISQKISSVETRVLSLETKVTDTNSRLTEMEVSRNFDTQVCDELSNKHKQLEKLLKAEKDENAALAKTVEKLKLENKSMSDDIVDVTSRLMRDNLLFFNFDEEKSRDDRRTEDCKIKIINFCTSKLGINDAETRFKIDRAHRIGKFDPKKSRPIVVKFNYYGDKMEVKQKARDNLDGKQYRISDQFPKAIQERRKILIPYLIQARQNNKEAVLSYDTLYIENRAYTADSLPPGPAPTQAPRWQQGKHVNMRTVDNSKRDSSPRASSVIQNARREADMQPDEQAMTHE
jgi:hypothetical protein